MNKTLTHYNEEQTKAFVMQLMTSLKSAYRRKEFEDESSQYKRDRKVFALSYDEAIDALVNEGKLNRNKAGAVSIPGGTGDAQARRDFANDSWKDSQRAWNETFARLHQ